MANENIHFIINEILYYSVYIQVVYIQVGKILDASKDSASSYLIVFDCRPIDMGYLCNRTTAS